jgi:5-formyltetrahydrofolate cyclo-ligase
MTEKTELRRKAEAHRKTLATPGYAAALAAHVDALAIAPGAVVAGYAAFRAEADPKALMQALAERGHPLALPAMTGKVLPLRFQRWCEGDALVVHPYGVAEPHPGAPVVEPSVLLVPLLAFDGHGTRLGYGGGYYDRTLAALRAAGAVRAIGIAYAGQELPEVPHGPHDERLDAVLTENGLVQFGL